MFLKPKSNLKMKMLEWRLKNMHIQDSKSSSSSSSRSEEQTLFVFRSVSRKLKNKSKLASAPLGVKQL